MDDRVKAEGLATLNWIQFLKQRIGLLIVDLPSMGTTKTASTQGAADHRRMVQTGRFTSKHLWMTKNETVLSKS